MRALIGIRRPVNGEEHAPSNRCSSSVKYKPRVLIVGPRREHQGGITRAIDSWMAAGLADVASIEIVELAAWDAPRRVQAFQSVWGLMRVVTRVMSRKSRPALIHVQVSSGASFYRKYVAAWAARCFAVPIVVHLHSGGFQDWVQHSRIHQYMARHLFGMSAVTIVVAGRWRPVVQSFGAQRVHVVPHMLPQEFRSALAAQDAAPARQSHRDRQHTILYYGRWAPIKGLDLLARAISELDSEYQARLTVRIFGNGERSWVERCFRCAGLAKVSINGWLSDADKLGELLAASVVIAPSRQEAFGASLLEVMAVGVPLITSDAGAIPEVVEGYSPALLTRAGNVADLRDGIAALVDGRWPAAVGVGTSGLSARFASSAIIGGLDRAYKECVGQHADKDPSPVSALVESTSTR
jgi:glycosyltransferase involved in cell wall biosynthesis